MEIQFLWCCRHSKAGVVFSSYLDIPKLIDKIVDMQLIWRI